MFNKGGIAGLMKQAQQMQENMKKAQEQLATIEVEGQSGAGMVKVVMTCLLKTTIMPWFITIHWVEPMNSYAELVRKILNCL